VEAGQLLGGESPEGVVLLRHGLVVRHLANLLSGSDLHGGDGIGMIGVHVDTDGWTRL